MSATRAARLQGVAKFSCSLLAATLLLLLACQSGWSQVFPRHAEICVGDIVSKEKLAKAFLKTKTEWYALYVGKLESTDHPRSVWRQIFVDQKNFCKGNPACLGPDPDAPKNSSLPVKLNTVTAEKQTLVGLRYAFENALQTNTKPGATYRMADPMVGLSYFDGDDSKNAIQCLPNEPIIVAKRPQISLPVRLRASADDLNIDGTDPDQKPAFKNVKPATLNFTRNGVEQKTNKTALQATVGYVVKLETLSMPYVGPTGLGAMVGEFIPYISATQSMSKIDNRAATYADTNNVAVGALLNTDLTFSQMPGVDHYIMARPQYLWNTKDKSEIASLKFLYQPWTLTGVRINTPNQIGHIDDATWLTLLFDIRSNTGEYTNVGIDPLAASRHKSFNRSGTRFGISLATPSPFSSTGSHVVLSVTETLLYGFAGSVEKIDLFDANLSYYFDSTSNFAFTVGYTKGRNEDTAERVQTFTAGLSAKF